MPDGPTSLLHVPKAAGTSMRIAIARALPHGAMAPWHSEPTHFDVEDASRLREPFRSSVALDERDRAALGSYRAVVGHFTLTTLLRVTRPELIATVLREPRARLLSVYSYWRVTPGLADRVAPWHVGEVARGSFAEFLAEPNIARTIDNKLCRMLMHGDPRVPHDGFLAQADAEALADAALERLRGLGFVGLVERHDEAWDGVGRLFGVTLERLSLNVTAADGAGPGSLPAGLGDSERALALLDERCAVDSVIYSRVAAERYGDERRARLAAQAAFAQQLVRLGDTAGTSAAALLAPDARFDRLKAEVEERDREIARLHAAVADRDAKVAALERSRV